MEQNLSALNSYLFDQLDRLNEPDMPEDELKKEVIRSKAVSDVAGKVIENANLALQASKFEAVQFGEEQELPKLLGTDYGTKR